MSKPSPWPTHAAFVADLELLVLSLCPYPKGEAMTETCQAYVERGGTLVAGGKRRHRRCKRAATVTRSREEGHWGGPVMRTYVVCAHHAAQWDKAERGEGLGPWLTSDF